VLLADQSLHLIGEKVCVLGILGKTYFVGGKQTLLFSLHVLGVSLGDCLK
jgi:hypothetical protein